MKKVSEDDFTQFYVRWYKTFYMKDDKTLRLGQAFLNEFYPSVSDPDVFYEKDETQAFAKIVDKYVK